MSNTEDWASLQQRLSAEIDDFANGEARPVDNVIPPAMVSTGFPKRDLQTAPVARNVAPPQPVAKAPPPAPASVSAPVTDSVSPNSLLARLKQQAAEKQASEVKKAGLQDQQKKLVSEALVNTFSYLRDLVDQINVVKPNYPAHYFLSEQLTFDGLSWHEGRADYRKLPSATENTLFDRVSLRYSLAGKNPILLEKEFPHMELLRRTLNEYGLPFEVDEIRNDRGRIERERYTIKREVRAGLLFIADYEVGDIQLRTLNVQRFGSAEYRIPVETLTHTTLEEIALLVLGESSKFVSRFKRVA